MHCPLPFDCTTEHSPNLPEQAERLHMECRHLTKKLETKLTQRLPTMNSATLDNTGPNEHDIAVLSDKRTLVVVMRTVLDFRQDYALKECC